MGQYYHPTMMDEEGNITWIFCSSKIPPILVFTSVSALWLSHVQALLLIA